MSYETATYRRAWDGIEHFGTLDREILAAWTYSERWTEAQRDLKAEIDGERRQERQIAESTARLVARLVAARCSES